MEIQHTWEPVEFGLQSTLSSFKQFPPKLHLQSLEDVCFSGTRSNTFYVRRTDWSKNVISAIVAIFFTSHISYGPDFFHLCGPLKPL